MDTIQEIGLLETALAYAKRGWFVFPVYEPKEGKCSCYLGALCENPAKHPRTNSGFKDATTDEATIRHWWEQWPNANIGIATEASQLIVLDCDKRHGGLDSLQRLVDQYGELGTLEALTGGGGQHYIFNATVVAKSRSGAIPGYPGIDIKAKGGYFIADPSTHISGNGYTWWWQNPIQDVPQWLATMIAEPKDHPCLVSSINGTIPNGHRNADLTSLAGSMRRKGCSVEGILAALSAENKRCDPPLEQRELERIAQSIGRYDPEPPKIIALQHLTEIDAAHALVDQHGANVRYCGKAGGWLVWDDRRWKRDEDGSINRLAEDATTKIADAASDIPDLEARKAQLTFAMGLRKRRVLENVVAAASWQDGIAIGDPARFDADPWLLNVTNGTVDLRTGELLSHDRANLLTKIVNIEYNAQADCPRWDRFLAEIFAGDRETIDFVQRAVGYTLTGLNREHCLFVLHGTGANGKSTFLSILERLLGDYGRAAAASTFTDRQSGAPSNDLAALKGARFVSSVETTDRASLAEGFVKSTTGGDRITARFLYQDFFDFEPVFKLWLGTNHKPVIRGVDEGIWRRIRLIPFTERFEGNRRDEDLRSKLENELPGILAQAIRGCLEWQRLGLSPSITVAQATASYRTEMDTFASFLDEWCIIRDGTRVKASELYQAYRSWAEANGEKPVSQRWFGLRLSERGFNKKPIDGYPHYHGLGLRTL